MELALKIVGVIASLFALYKLVVDVILAKSSKHREDYEFAKKFINALNNKDTHQFVVERGFLALTGKSYSVQEIKHLLSFDNPSEIIRLRASSSNFIQLHENQSEYVWKGIYTNRTVKMLAPYGYIILYGITASLALLPIFLKFEKTLQSAVLVLFSLSFGGIAINLLIRHEDFKCAKKLMQRQNERVI